MVTLLLANPKKSLDDHVVQNLNVSEHVGSILTFFPLDLDKRKAHCWEWILKMECLLVLSMLVCPLLWWVSYQTSSHISWNYELLWLYSVYIAALAVVLLEGCPWTCKYLFLDLRIVRHLVYLLRIPCSKHNEKYIIYFEIYINIKKVVHINCDHYDFFKNSDVDAILEDTVPTKILPLPAFWNISHLGRGLVFSTPKAREWRFPTYRHTGHALSFFWFGSCNATRIIPKKEWNTSCTFWSRRYDKVCIGYRCQMNIYQYETAVIIFLPIPTYWH